jgi:hypothetical protein
LGTLNGNGVERYLIDSAGVLYYLDRENICGYDLINFDRHVMVKIITDSILLADFSDFTDVQIRSKIPLVSPIKTNAIRINGQYLFIANTDDSLRIYDIVNPNNPTLINVVGIANLSIIGTTICTGSTYNQFAGMLNDIYNISDPYNIRFIRCDTIRSSGTTWHCFMREAQGDTVIFYRFYSLTFNLEIAFFSYDTLGNRIFIVQVGGGSDVSAYFFNQAFAFGSSRYYLYSYTDYLIKGIMNGSYPFNLYSKNLDLYNDYLLFNASLSEITTFTSPSPDSFFRPVYTNSIPYYGTQSSCIYKDTVTNTKYLLSGFKSNNSLHAYRFNAQGNPVEVGWCDSIAPLKIFIKGRTAICASSGKLAAVDLTNIGNNLTLPVIHSLSGFSNPLIDIANRDSFYYAITDSVYYVIKYNQHTGFTVLSSINYPNRCLTSIAQNGTSSFVLKGNIGVMDNITHNPPNQPYLYREYRLPNATYKNIRIIPTINAIWACGEAGTDIVTFGNSPLAHFSPEYISSGDQLTLLHDTLFVADGPAGFKAFRFQSWPTYLLIPIGQYTTRNNLTHVAINGSDFYTADYYSLQHLRWGEPIGIEDNPDILPQAIELSQNYPNPFNATTSIRYTLNKQTSVKIDIYDILGRHVANLIDCQQPAGNHTAIWDAAAFPSGIYFYTLQTGDNHIAKKMILLK